MINDDHAIKRIRDARRRVSAEHGHDPRAVVAYYKELQQRRQERERKRTGVHERGARYGRQRG